MANCPNRKKAEKIQNGSIACEVADGKEVPICKGRCENESCSRKR
jgi:hypothetical protein